jgi:hypothetical protein
MHDIRLLREQLDVLRDGMRRRGKLAELEPLLARAEAIERLRVWLGTLSAQCRKPAQACQ